MATLTAASFKDVTIPQVKEGMVDQYHIDNMMNYINKHGYEAFKDATFHGAFSEEAFKYIHPIDEMRSTKGFELIQQAFFNAYV